VNYIHEFPHPNLIIHYHPSQEEFSLDDARFALSERLHAIELDLHLDRRSGEIVCSHDRPTPHSPALEQVIDLILTWKGAHSTVYGDGQQFFLVLDPKDGSVDLFRNTIRVLDRYARHFSTAVGEAGAPQGITVVISGKYRDRLHARLGAGDTDRLCIVEGRDYGHSIRDLSNNSTPFQWVALRHGTEKGRVNALHVGSDPQWPGKHNVRVWDCPPPDLARCVATGVDQINCDREHVADLKRILRSQQPKGRWPALAIRDNLALLCWRGPASNDLYAAIGQVREDGLRFSRQIDLTRFLARQPSAVVLSCGLMPDGRILICYESANDRTLVGRLARIAIQCLPKRLARRVCRPKSPRYIAGRFDSLDRFVSFSGREHCLALPSGTIVRGRRPALAVAPDGRVLILFEGAGQRGLCTFSGTLGATGKLIGQVYELGAEPIYAGVSPAIAVDDADRVLIVYQEAESRALAFVSGSIDPSGRIIGKGVRLVLPGTSLVCHPSAAVAGNGRAYVAYQVCSTNQLGCVSVTYDDAGHLDNAATPVFENGLGRGRYPNVVSSRDDDIFLVYTSDADHSLRYQRLFPTGGRLVGDEKRVGFNLHTD
jgi:hypothetical protein